MATVTLKSIFRKVEHIIKEKKNFTKNVKNYLDYMENNCLISNYGLVLSKDGRFHVTIRLFGQNAQSNTFNIKKIIGAK